MSYLMLHLGDYWYDENDVENNDFSSISTLKEPAAVSSTAEELGILSTVVMTCVVSLSVALDSILAAFAGSSAMLTDETREMTSYQVLLHKEGWFSPQTAAPYFLKSTI